MTTFEELRKTPIGWRFNSDKHHLLGAETIKRLKVNSEGESQEKWFHITQSREGHLFKIPEIFWSDLLKTGSSVVDWRQDKFLDDRQIEELTTTVIEQSDEIIFFWGARNSIETDWGVFSKYWNDFCYPDDDTILIVIKGKDILITYIEEEFTFYSISLATHDN